MSALTVWIPRLIVLLLFLACMRLLRNPPMVWYHLKHLVSVHFMKRKLIRQAHQKNETTWLGLREMALNLNPSELGAPGGGLEPLGFIMEAGKKRNLKITTVAVRDGTLSMYFSTGGGAIGAGQSSPHAAQVAKDVVAAVGEFTSRLQRVSTYPIPAQGRIRFFIITGQGIFSAETDEKSVAEPDNPLCPLFSLAQIAMRQILSASPHPSEGARSP